MTENIQFIRFEKCHSLMDALSKKNKQIIKLQLDIADLREENEQLKERRHEDINDLSVISMKYKALEKENNQLKKSLERKQRRIDAYEDYIKTLKEDGVLDD